MPLEKSMKSHTIFCAAILTALPATCLEAHSSSFCETRELTLPFSGSLDVRTGGVGQIAATGWDNDYVFVRAEICAPDASQAASVQIDTSSNHVWASGPVPGNWGVSYAISAPHQSGLSLSTNTGAISVTDISGKLQIQTLVGALSLTRVSGDVKAQTSVGAISVVLGGDHWEGAGLDAKTMCGGVAVDVPEGYSAHFDLSTSLGSGSRSFDSGAGGAPIRIQTSIGAIAVKTVPGKA
jgi:hypothetical protein